MERTSEKSQPHNQIGQPSSEEEEKLQANNRGLYWKFVCFQQCPEYAKKKGVFRSNLLNNFLEKSEYFPEI